jgi:oligoendopeptidase F
MAVAAEKLPKWDLSDLYSGIDDPRIETDIAGNLKSAQNFEEKYKGKISDGSIEAAELRTALEEFGLLIEAHSRSGQYAQLLYSTNTQDAKIGALLQKTRESGASFAKHFVFFDLEIGLMAQEKYEVIASNEVLADYKHYLDHQREVAKHQLSEPEEKILVETANSRGSAFGRLFTEVTGRVKFRLKQDGEEKELLMSEIMSHLYDPDRAVRKAASESITESLHDVAHVSTFIFNTLLHEKEVLDRLRSFEYPAASRNLSDELSKKVVDTMAGVCVKNFDLVADYYQLKGQLLGIDDLREYDRYAPISDRDVHVPYEEAKSLVLEAFESFSPKLSELTKPFFEKNWIDAAPVDGKDSGAFCSLGSPNTHPYVFMNYMGKSRDVMTLAHELGHGVHAVLAQRNHYLDFGSVLPLAETASTFGEALVFDQLMEKIEDPAEKLALLCGKIEDSFATVFRQISMYRFEERAHMARREQGELATEQYNEIWQSSMGEMFGDSLSLSENHGWWWLYIPHVFQVPFYVYAYAFGELLVFSLYALYKKEGDSFIEKYFELLASGGAKSPAELVSSMGFDIEDEAFWQAGCDLIRARVEQAKELAKQIS